MTAISLPFGHDVSRQAARWEFDYNRYLKTDGARDVTSTLLVHTFLAGMLGRPAA